MSPLALISGGSIILVLSAVIFGMHWKGVALEERARNVAITSELSSAKEAISTIKNVLKDQVKLTNSILAINEKSVETANVYREKVATAERSTNEAIRSLDLLKKSEHRNALEQPFKRGNAVNKRVTGILCRAWGPWASDNTHCSSTKDNGNASTINR